MVFVNLYHILYCDISVNNQGWSHTFHSCAKIVSRLHTENSDIPKAHPRISGFHEYHSESQTPPNRHPESTSRHPSKDKAIGIFREYKMSTDDNGLSRIMRGEMSWIISMTSPLEISGGNWVVLMETRGAWMCLVSICPCSMKSLQYRPERHDFFWLYHTESSTYQNVYLYLYKVDKKSLGCKIFVSQ